MTFWQKLFGRKASEARIAMSMNLLGQPATTPANYEGFSRQGYQKSVVVYSSINKIASAAKGVPWLLYRGKGARRTEIEEHELLKLLERPNPLQGQSAFFESVFAFYALAGNSYIEAVGPRPGAPPKELYSVRPDRMKVIVGKQGFPEAYEYTASATKKRWQVDFINMKSAILHMKTFNPTNDWYGQSPLEAAMLNLDQANAVNTWNSALLKNMATPSGVLQVEVSDANPTGSLTTEEYNRMKAMIDSEWSGAHNAGRPKLIEGGMKWQAISLSPKDMDFINNKSVTARDLALAFGVPPMLLGIPGDNTYSNYKEARQAFYEETVLPLLSFAKDEFNNWLTPAFGDGLELDYDVDSIEALQPKREAKFTSIQNASWLTINEKREATGYEPIAGFDVLMVGQTPYDINEPFTSEDEDESGNESGQPDDNTTNTDSEESETQSGDEAETDETEQEESEETNPAKGLSFKAVNLITRNDKVKSWRAQNRRRKHFENAFYLDLKDQFKEIAQKLDKVVRSASSMQTLEYAILKAIDSEFAELEKLIEKHELRVIKDFGDVIFEGIKSAFPDLVETKSNAKFNDYAVRYARKRAGEAVSQIKGTTQKQVHRYVRDLTAQAIEEGLTMTEVADRLTGKFTELSPGRARTIARTEVTIASQNGSLEAAKSLEVPDLQKEWVSAQDDRVRGVDGGEENHAVMNGQREPLDAKFAVPPDADMDGPGDPAGGASQVINCRCVLVYTRAR